MGYLSAFAAAIFRPGVWWWLSLALAYFLGIGFFSDYPKARDQANEWLGYPLMPEPVPIWLIIVPFLLWALAHLAHREAMTRLHAGRVIFGDPYIDAFVPMYGQDDLGSVQVGENDIAKITVHNSPYDGANGSVIKGCYGSISLYDAKTQLPVLEFDYPRWQENQKPGYHQNPRDHIPDEWNRRDLRPSGERSTLNFLVKSRSEGMAYGFRAQSQIKHPLWHDPKLVLPPGHYVAKLTVSGVGLRHPAEQWLEVTVGGVDEPMRVVKCAKPETKWF